MYLFLWLNLSFASHLYGCTLKEWVCESYAHTVNIKIIHTPFFFSIMHFSCKLNYLWWHSGIGLIPYIVILKIIIFPIPSHLHNKKKCNDFYFQDFPNFTPTPTLVINIDYKCFVYNSIQCTRFHHVPSKNSYIPKKYSNHKGQPKKRNINVSIVMQMRSNPNLL